MIMDELMVEGTVGYMIGKIEFRVVLSTVTVSGGTHIHNCCPYQFQRRG